MISLFKNIFAHRSPLATFREPVWEVLKGTGNGIGGAPASIRSIPELDDDAFDDLYCRELIDCFWHQGTIYVSTPFAVFEVLNILPHVQPHRQEALLLWLSDCLDAELLGECDGSRAGIKLSTDEQAELDRYGLVRPSVMEVLLSNLPRLQTFTDKGRPVEVRRAARELMAKMIVV